jgi:hypothetical protein
MTEEFRRNCEEPDCSRRATWFVGREFDRGIEGVRSRGHCACDRHLAECCRVTLMQLGAEQWQDARLDVRPIVSVEEIV